ncbi:MAG: hypothetical protein AAF467_02805 [Actinomycetota bacterium]
MFFNVGGPEILVIAMVALIAVGPDQLPGMIRRIGRFAAEARAVTSNLRNEFMAGIDEIADSVEEAKAEVEGTWLGTGSADDPVVPRGFAEQEKKRAAELDADADAREAAAAVGASAGGRLGRDDGPGADDGSSSNGSGGGRLGRSDDPMADPEVAAAVEPSAVDTQVVDAEPTEVAAAEPGPVDVSPTDIRPAESEAAVDDESVAHGDETSIGDGERS